MTRSTIEFLKQLLNKSWHRLDRDLLPSLTCRKVCIKIQATTRTTEDGIPELTRIPEKMATTEPFVY